MFKRGVGNYVILALCVLALVLQPVKVFADDYYYNSENEFISELNSILGGEYFSTFEIDQTVGNIVGDFIVDFGSGSYSVTLDDIIGGWFFYSQQLSTLIVYPKQTMVIKSFSAGGTVTSTWTTVRYIYRNGSITEQAAQSRNTPLYKRNATGQTLAYNIYSDNSASVFIDPYNNSYNYDPDYLDPSIPSIPSYPSGDSNSYVPDADIGQVNWPNFIYALTSWFFYNGIMRTNLPGEDATWNNSNWISIADALTYQFLCQTNFGSSEVTWGNNTYPNYLYQLSDLMYMMDESTGRLADYIEELELEDVGSNLADIKSDLEAAFPAAEVAINDSVADTVLDDSSGSGLTASKIVGAKSDLDDSLSKFSISLGSDAEFSGVGSALDGQDWSFWSQQTFDNCYMFTFDPFEAQLMDDEDVAIQEDSLFKQLLGWD